MDGERGEGHVVGGGISSGVQAVADDVTFMVRMLPFMSRYIYWLSVIHVPLNGLELNSPVNKSCRVILSFFTWLPKLTVERNDRR